MKQSKIQILNTFIIKIIAIVLMTFDHIGLFLITYSGQSITSDTFFTHPMSLTGYILRCIGRLALPLFAMLFAEAMRHTSSREKYMSKLGLMAVLVLVTEVITTYAFNKSYGANIFLTLLSSAAFIYFYEKKDNKRFLCALPCAYILLCLVSTIFLCAQNKQIIPIWLTADYDLYGFILCIGLYMTYKLSDWRVMELTKDHGDTRTIEELREYPYYRTFTNIIWLGIVVILNVFLYVLAVINPAFDFYNIGMQSYAIFAGLILLMYNGKKGYTSKKVQLGFYAYYPLHLLILFIIFFIIFKR